MLPALNGQLTYRRILSTWWPLAASWLMMGFELPAVSAVMARLVHPEVSLAAYGGVVFPLALLVEAPIIMLLAASVALARDFESYRWLRRFMAWSAAGLTLIHLAIALTPLYGLVAGRLIGVPPAVLGPARVGLIIMTPWTGSIAYRRFHQGVLIRFGRSRTVGVGTAVRLGTNFSVLAAGYLVGHVSGIVIGTVAVAVGVVSEASFIGWAVRPVLRGPLRHAPPAAEPLRLPPFLRFYGPLALTPLLTLTALPLLSAAVSRLPEALASLAVWPVINGITFGLRALGLAYNEVAVALVEEPRSARPLFRFSLVLAGALTLILALVAATPFGWFWFHTVSGLSVRLSRLAVSAIWIPLLIPGLTALQSWYQGALVHARRTRGITESVAVYLAAAVLILAAAVKWSPVTGIYVGLAAMMVGNVLQTVWLRIRAGSVLAGLQARDRVEPPPGGPAPDAGRA